MSSNPNRAFVSGPSQAGKPHMDSADIVIIGNGIAGLTAAIEARQLAPDKRIVIITDQMHPTINTPALKQFAIGKVEREQLLAYPAGTERAERIHVITSRVEEIHARSKYVTMRGNRTFGYGSLLIATGSSPQGISHKIPGREFDGVMTLHRLHDYLQLRRRIPETEEAVVIGGGVHAIETVMGLHYWGIRVHWLIRGKTFMRGMLDEAGSRLVLDHIRRQGIDIRTETEITGIVGRIGVVAGVITNQQEMIPCQLVITCTGTQPVMTLAERCSVPIKYKKGIIVDDKLRSSVRDIYVAGDVAALKNPQTGEYEPRALWYAAGYQGRVAGAMLAGRTDVAQQPFGVPWHATHLGELSMLTVGDPMLTDSRITVLTDTSQGSYRRMTVMDDRLIGYLALGSTQPDSLAIKRIIDEGLSIRGITKELLKGKFDARQYLSQVRTRSATSMVTKRQLTGAMADSASWEAQRLPDTGEMTRGRYPKAQPATRQTDSELFAVSAESSPPVYEEELDAFSGSLPNPNLPDISFHGIPDANGKLMLGTGGKSAAQVAHDMFAEDDFDPFTGNLPAIGAGTKAKTLAQPAKNNSFSGQKEEFFEDEFNPFDESLVIQQSPSPSASPSTAEWLLDSPRSGRNAAVPVENNASSQTGKTSLKSFATPKENRPKHSLWSYSDQSNLTRGGNRR